MCLKLAQWFIVYRKITDGYFSKIENKNTSRKTENSSQWTEIVWIGRKNCCALSLHQTTESFFFKNNTYNYYIRPPVLAYCAFNCTIVSARKCSMANHRVPNTRFWNFRRNIWVSILYFKFWPIKNAIIIIVHSGYFNSHVCKTTDIAWWTTMCKTWWIIRRLEIRD